MEKNDFLILNEIIYHIHTCETLDELRHTILAQIRFIIPYSYASIMTVHIDPVTKELVLSDPVCYPDSFAPAAEEWIARSNQDHSLWLSHAPETTVVRDSEIFGEKRLTNFPLYRDIFQRYNVFDIAQMNVAYQHQVMALLSLLHTRIDGAFTDQEMFFFRSLSNHINYAYYQKKQQAQGQTAQSALRSVESLTQEYALTRRETEILTMVLQGKTNEEILSLLQISQHTLWKHLQNLYRKCGVSSRWELWKLREGS